MHGAAQRLTRWLLTAQDLTDSFDIEITQEELSALLGTKRVTITAAAGELQRAKLIEYRRGHIHILNRTKMKALACDCYSTVRELNKGLYN